MGTWKEVRLGTLCRTTSGGTPSRSISEYYGGDIPWVKSGELNDGYIQEIEEYISENGIKNSSAKVFPSGTLLIALYGATVGKLGILQKDAATNQAVCAIFPDETKLNRDFLFYFLLSQREALIDSGAGGAQPNISQEIVRNVCVPLPTLVEQERIAGILARADRLCQLRRYALQLSDGYLQSVFLQLFGDPVTNPMGLKVTELRKVCKRVTDGTHQPPKWSKNGYPFLFVSNVIDGELDFNTQKFISHKTWEELTARCPVEVNDILYTTVGSYGNAALVRTERPFSFQRHIAHIKPDPSQIHPEFLLGMLQSSGVKQQADRQARGVAQKTLNLRELKEFSIFVPELAAQIKYVELRRRFERLRSQQHEAARQADHLFATLLHRAFPSPGPSQREGGLAAGVLASRPLGEIREGV